MNKKANAGDDQQHHQRKLVEVKRKVRLKRPRPDPGSKKFGMGRGQRSELGCDEQHQGKRRPAEQERHRDHSLPGEFLARKSH